MRGYRIKITEEEKKRAEMDSAHVAALVSQKPQRETARIQYQQEEQRHQLEETVVDSLISFSQVDVVKNQETRAHHMHDFSQQPDDKYDGPKQRNHELKAESDLSNFLVTMIEGKPTWLVFLYPFLYLSPLGQVWSSPLSHI